MVAGRFQQVMMSSLLLRGLMVSIILNLFLIGGVLGAAYHLFWSDNAILSKQGPQRGLRFAAETLSEDQQHNFRKTLRMARHEAKPLIQAAKAARSEVRELVSAPSFDRTAVQAAVDKAREADIAVRKRMETALIDYAAQLSQEDRIKLAEGLAKNGPLRQGQAALQSAGGLKENRHEHDTAHDD